MLYYKQKKRQREESSIARSASVTSKELLKNNLG